MNKRKLILLLACLVIVISKNLFAQVSQNTLTGAYIYNFARYTTWPNEEQNENFKIILITENSNIINELKNVSKTRLIKNKTVLIETSLTIPANFDADVRLIFIGSDKSKLFHQAFLKAENKPILFVTENFDEKRNIMFNLYNTPNNELAFEVNRANIIIRNLIIDPEVILLGGTDIDLAELYRSSQKSIDTLQYKLLAMNDSLLSIHKEMTNKLEVINKQKDDIENQNLIIKEHNKQIEKGNTDIETHRKELSVQQDKIAQQEAQLKKQLAQLNEQLTELSEQQLYINNQQSAIQKSKIFLDSINNEIETKNIEIGRQDRVIERQNTLVILSFITGGLLLFILVYMIISYRAKNRKNKILKQQKDQIEKINKKLETTNKNLFETITKLKETQSQLITSEKMASLGVLTAGIAHEINNPVNFVYTGINSLSKDIDDLFSIHNTIIQAIDKHANTELKELIEKKKEEGELEEVSEIIKQTIDDIRIGAERAAEIIRGLRNFSRIDKNTKQTYNVHEGLDSSLLLLKNKFKNHIKINKEYGNIPAIECYPGKLNQAFINVLSNAIDAIETEGSITISTHNTEDKVEIKVTDSGKGISPEIIDKIFDPFFTTKNVGKGVGLGLSITYAIIQEHNGSIEVKSELKNGTVFTILLPCSIY